MNQRKVSYLLICTMLMSLFILPGRAYAYLDPGSGSYILQLLLAGLLAVSFTLKTFWRNFAGYLCRLFHRKKDERKNVD